MRIKTLTAPKMADALTIIRQELGPEALILSTRKVINAQGEQTLEITAAVNEPEPPSKPVEPTPPLPSFLTPKPDTIQRNTQNATLETTLRHHGVSEGLISKLTAALPGLQAAGFSATEALDMLLSKMVRFLPAAEALAPGKLHVFVGPPGSGKTTLVAKLAVQMHHNGRHAGILSLDDQKLAGFEPLAITAETLGTEAHLISNATSLHAALQTLAQHPTPQNPKPDTRHPTPILIDTPALNPYQPQAFANLKQRLEGLGVPVLTHLVIPADMNADDMGLLPVATHRFNLQSLIVTRLDCTSRYGALLNTAVAAGLPLGLASHNGNVAAAPLSLTPQWLAQSLGTLPRQPWEFTS